jgi:hypothetical protein
MKHIGRVAFSPDDLIEARLILVDEALSGQGGIDEDHAEDLLRPALRIEARLDTAQRMSNQHIWSRYGPCVERRMQIVHHVGEDLRPGPRITESIAGTVEGANATRTPDPLQPVTNVCNREV